MIIAEVRDKSLFIEGSIRKDEIKKYIYLEKGKLKDSNVSLFSSYRYLFDANRYDIRKSKKWLTTNRIKYKNLYKE
jgi:hypothetical protein